MAAPTPTVRQVPTQRAINEGFHAYITMSLKPQIGFWEESLAPPEIDGGAPIPTKTQFNQRYHTFDFRGLIELKPFKATVAFDPDILQSDINGVMNVNQTLTWTYPDGSTWCFYGALIKFTQAAMKDGERPKADCEFAPSCWDPVNHVEAGPVFTPASGT